MNWFYAKEGQQAGPVDDAEFERLIKEGTIQRTTLVWRNGMAQWQTLSAVRLDLTAPPPPGSDSLRPADQTTCAECGKMMSVEEMVQIGSTTVCAACKPGYVQKLREGAVPFAAGVAASEMRYAGFWMRVAAYVIDMVILTVVTLPLSIWLNFKMQQALAFQGGQTPNWAEFAGYWAMSMAWSTGITILYGWLFVGRYGATPGKMLLKLKVVTEDGGRVSYLRALGRQGGQLVSSFTCMIGFLLPLFNDEKRALHDYICKTRVIYK